MTDSSMADRPQAVRITADGPTATVLVDGADVSRRVQGYVLDHRAGELPMVVLYLNPRTDPVVFDGMARVAVAAEQPPAQAVAEFLTGLDPLALEQAALHRDDLGNERGALTRAMLAQLADWAQGKGD